MSCSGRDCVSNCNAFNAWMLVSTTRGVGALKREETEQRIVWQKRGGIGHPSTSPLVVGREKRVIDRGCRKLLKCVIDKGDCQRQGLVFDVKCEYITKMPTTPLPGNFKKKCSTK